MDNNANFKNTWLRVYRVTDLNLRIFQLKAKMLKSILPSNGCETSLKTEKMLVKSFTDPILVNYIVYLF